MNKIFRQSFPRFKKLITSKSLFCTESSKKIINIGSQLSVEKHFSVEEVETFARLTCVSSHCEKDSTVIKLSNIDNTVVPSELLLGLFSGILGTKLPGIGSVLLNLEVKYHKKASVNQTVKAYVEVIDIKGREVLCDLEASSSENTTFLTGTSRLLVPRSLVARIKKQTSF